MAPRAHAAHVLTRAALAVAVALSVLGTASPARAHNTWDGGYRKFPWLAGRIRTLTTLPGECPHCPGVQSSSAWKAIDVGDMDYETVTSVGPGTVDVYDPSGGAAGMYLRIKDKDGTYITYEHLKQALVTSGTVVAGQPIAVSGCSGNCSGAHLHFQRHDAPSFGSNALSLEPISGHAPLAHTVYTGDNAGIGYSAMGYVSPAVQAIYESGGGYRRVGVTANIGEVWSPCRNDELLGSWWRYTCAPRDGVSGTVQTLYHGTGNRERAILDPAGDGGAYVMHRGALGAYTDTWNGQDWIYWLGYPTGNRTWTTAGVYVQHFENGTIIYDPETCRSSIYLYGTFRDAAYYCD